MKFWQERYTYSIRSLDYFYIENEKEKQDDINKLIYALSDKLMYFLYFQVYFSLT
jgi:hypothetical protein